jgi:hypothetical protein
MFNSDSDSEDVGDMIPKISEFGEDVDDIRESKSEFDETYEFNTHINRAKDDSLQSLHNILTNYRYFPEITLKNQTFNVSTNFYAWFCDHDIFYSNTKRQVVPFIPERIDGPLRTFMDDFNEQHDTNHNAIKVTLLWGNSLKTHRNVMLQDALLKQGSKLHVFTVQLDDDGDKRDIVLDLTELGHARNIERPGPDFRELRERLKLVTLPVTQATQLYYKATVNPTSTDIVPTYTSQCSFLCEFATVDSSRESRWYEQRQINVKKVKQVWWNRMFGIKKILVRDGVFHAAMLKFAKRRIKLHKMTKKEKQKLVKGAENQEFKKRLRVTYQQSLKCERESGFTKSLSECAKEYVQMRRDD